jgi:hypothetical protein
MTFQQCIFQLIVFIIFLVIYLILKNFLPSFFNEKGKNLATTQDISKITTLVEEVKSAFTKETEYLKAELSLLTNAHSGLISEERFAIIDYNEKYFKWLNILLDSSLRDVDKYDNVELDRHSKLIGEYYIDLVNSQTRFNLFVEDSELTSYANQLIIQTLELLNPLPFNCIFALQGNNREMENMRATERIENQSIKHKEILDKRTPIFDEFRNKMLEKYKIISPKTHKFQAMSREYLYKVIKSKG